MLAEGELRLRARDGDPNGRASRDQENQRRPFESKADDAHTSFRPFVAWSLVAGSQPSPSSLVSSISQIPPAPQLLLTRVVTLVRDLAIAHTWPRASTARRACWT